MSFSFLLARVGMPHIRTSGKRWLEEISRTPIQTDTLPDDPREGLDEPARIRVFPLVEAESLLVEVAEKVEGLHVHVGALDRALERAPEIFQPVGMDVAHGVAHRMVNHLMNVIRVHADVGAKRVRVDRRAPSASIPARCLALHAAEWS